MGFMTCVKDLQALYDYGYWANRKIFDVLVRLTQEEFTQQVAGSFGSVRNTMVHMMSAEWGWLDRSGGAQRGPALVAANYPTVASLVDQWRQVEANMREFLATLKDSDLDQLREFSFGGPAYSMRRGDLLQHAAIHCVHHRGQVALLLRSLGHAPGNFDVLFYYGQDQGVALQSR
jgi:uncharacterized damage-inducible protein DinB